MCLEYGDKPQSVTHTEDVFTHTHTHTHTELITLQKSRAKQEVMRTHSTADKVLKIVMMS